MERGYHVRALVRSKASCGFDRAETIETGDLTGRDDLPHLLAGCDVVVNLAARVHVLKEKEKNPEAAFVRFNADMAVQLARAASTAGVARFVQMSSVAAVRSVTPPGLIVGDGFPPAPQSSYGRSKLVADEALLQISGEIGLEVVCLRPPTVFGPNVGAYFRKLLKSAQMGIPLPIGGIDNKRSFIFNDNLADAVLATATGVAQGAYLVTDSPPVSTADMYRLLLRAYGRRGWVPALPANPVLGLAHLALGDRADSLLGWSAFEGSRFQRDFTWEPPVPLQAAIETTVSGTV